ncbi:MAG: alpha/beta hydrolase [Alphaproteobacteria bacterium]|nr:alpha/beta hydrolase [Alphaproteobacteria bacterium]
MKNEQPPLIVLLPGLDGTGRLFEPLLAYIGDLPQHQVISYKNIPQNLNDLAGDVEARLDKNRPVLLVAESFSSLVALRLLERGNLQLAGILFFAGFARAPCPLLINVARFAPSFLIKFFASNRLLAKLFFLTNKMPLDVFDLYVDVVRGIPADVFKIRLQILHQAKKPPSFKTRVPFGLLRVKNDLLVSKRATDELSALCDDLFLREADGTHFFIQTRPEQSAGIIREFLQKITD